MAEVIGFLQLLAEIASLVVSLIALTKSDPPRSDGSKPISDEEL